MSWRYRTSVEEGSKGTHNNFLVLTPSLASRLPKMEESQALGWFLLFRFSIWEPFWWWNDARPNWSKCKSSSRSWWRISDSHVWYTWPSQEANHAGNKLKSTWVWGDSLKWTRSFHWKLLNQKQKQKTKWSIKGAKTKISFILTKILSTPERFQFWTQFKWDKEIASRGNWRQTYKKSNVWNL